MKNIVIPVGKISSLAILASGMCTSALVDESLKKTTTGNKVVDAVGRNGATSLISTAFALVAALAWFDDSMDIKIPLKKKEKEEENESKIEAARESKLVSDVREKDIKRFRKAIKLWESILTQAEETKNWLDVHRKQSVICVPHLISKHDVEKFNEKMMKLGNRIGFAHNPICYSDDSLRMMDEIFANMDMIDNNMRKCYEYCCPASDDVCGIPENSSASPESSINDELNEYYDDLMHFVIDNLITHRDDVVINDIINRFINKELDPGYAFKYIATRIGELESDDNEDHDGISVTDTDDTFEYPIKISDELIKKLSEQNISPDDIDSIDFSDIYQKFISGELSAVDACNKVAELAIEAKKAAEAVNADKDMGSKNIASDEDDDIES